MEAAGFVLAVVPLLISAVECYQEGMDPIKAFWGWERELPQFIRKLRNQEVHYQQTIKLLLEPVTSEEELAEMIGDPMSSAWKDEGIAENLRDKLGESHQAYQDVINDVDRIMRAIASKLDLDRDARVRTCSGGYSAKFELTITSAGPRRSRSHGTSQSQAGFWQVRI